MKFCQAHWDELREAIKDRGLWHLVTQDGETLVQNMLAEANGQGDGKTYDPLANATMMIYGEAIKAGGLYLMSDDEHGNEYCPLCEVEKHTQSGAAKNWIEGCTDSILTHCREHGLTAPMQ